MADVLEVLTVRDVADVLKVGTKTVYTMAQNGELPAFKVGGQWRFRRADIDRWIQAQLDAGTGAGRTRSGQDAAVASGDDDLEGGA